MGSIFNTRINLAGCSGIGKTTLAKSIANWLEIPFVSGSYSDLVPATKEVKHTDMIQKDAKEIFEQDVQLLGARKKLYSQYSHCVSDRSYLDSAAYMIQKLSHRLPTCDVEDFIEKCRVLTLLQCNYLIFLPFTMQYMKEWEIEDNGKRVLNKFYQAEVSQIMSWLIQDYWDTRVIKFIDNNPVLRMEDQQYGTTEILVLCDIPHDKRMDAVAEFIER